MDPDRIDLTPLDTLSDSSRFERLVGAITQLAVPELARRRSRESPMLLLANWARPLLAAAAVLATLSIGTLSMSDRPSGEEEIVVVPGIAEALEVPSPAVDWLNEARAPSASDLLIAVADGGGT